MLQGLTSVQTTVRRIVLYNQVGYQVVLLTLLIIQTFKYMQTDKYCLTASFDYMGTWLELYIDQARTNSDDCSDDKNKDDKSKDVLMACGEAGTMMAPEQKKLHITFSSKQRWWRRVWTEIKSVESNYPGLHPCNFGFDKNSHQQASVSQQEQDISSIKCGKVCRLLNSAGNSSVSRISIGIKEEFQQQYKLFENYLSSVVDPIQARQSRTKPFPSVVPCLLAKTLTFYILKFSLSIMTCKVLKILIHYARSFFYTRKPDRNTLRW